MPKTVHFIFEGLVVPTNRLTVRKKSLVTVKKVTTFAACFLRQHQE
jgi:hypothetical protein